MYELGALGKFSSHAFHMRCYEMLHLYHHIQEGIEQPQGTPLSGSFWALGKAPDSFTP